MADYTVVRGDNPWAIWRDQGPKAEGITFPEFLTLNNLTDNSTIHPGDVLTLTTGGTPATTTTTADGTTIETDYTDDDTTRFNGLPGNPEIWKDTDTGKIYVVYYPEGMDPPVPLRYLVNSEDVLATYFGDKPVAYDHEYTTNQMAGLGAVTYGDVGEIQDTTGDPWSGFTIKMEKAKEVMPWLEDPEVFAIIASAYLEGRTPEPYEFVGTSWYDSHNDAERAWLTKVAQDPSTAAQDLKDGASQVRDAFLKAGVAVPDDDVIDYIASKWIQGTWSLTERNDQIAVVTGGGEGVTIDSGLKDIVGDTVLAEGATYIDTVKTMWKEWLGSTYQPSDAELAKWAGIIRDDEQGGTARLTEMLRSQRMALFPEYEDNTLTWNDISGPWKGMAYNAWGVQAQDDDAEFVEIVKMNDAVEAQKQLRTIGLDRGYERVTTAARNSLERGMQTGVRGVA